MTPVKLLIPIVLLVVLVSVTACSHLFSSEQSLPAAHPEALGEGRVSCSECHEDQIKGILKPYESFNHTTVFVREHRLYAARDARLCGVCHASSFCNDCHARQIEMKPSVKLGNRPDRDLIHRGDYLTRHQIDGKVDPTSCYRCHGRANNDKCITCHR